MTTYEYDETAAGPQYMEKRHQCRVCDEWWPESQMSYIAGSRFMSSGWHCPYCVDEDGHLAKKKTEQ